MTFFWNFGGLGAANKKNLTPRESCISWIYFSNEVSNSPQKYHMQKLRPWEVDVSTTPIGAHKPFGVSSFGVRVLDFLYVKNIFGASL
jgi:hypothetical protein